MKIKPTIKTARALARGVWQRHEHGIKAVAFIVIATGALIAWIAALVNHEEHHRAQNNGIPAFSEQVTCLRDGRLILAGVWRSGTAASGPRVRLADPVCITLNATGDPALAQGKVTITNATCIIREAQPDDCPAATTGGAP